ncbi:hypothetical protein K443DRAFT_7373 [Laccaria amethystina LaAM-08-1]|uniref:Uncharacterized protein n=1 Tax=Laccaria amethystina LaAM-08-1 TaxID=1095629 RepID=A0A0C9XSQ0_9AGAR|nr:hypothetical protein K443DRAFT_7373 [Laccaria amethystina LaAM-08-1]
MPTTTRTVTKCIDAEEGWASELRCYLSTMQKDMTKKTNLFDWWQFSSVRFFAPKTGNRGPQPV